jgi:hypothetical protein
MQKSDLWDGILPYAKSTNFFIPGKGVQYPDCGSIKARGCGNISVHPGHQVFVRYYKQTCMRKTCPVCFESWCSHEAQRALVRVATWVCGKEFVETCFRRARDEASGKSNRIFHERFVSLLEKGFKRDRPGHGFKRPIHVVYSPEQDLLVDGSNYAELREEIYRIAKKSGLFGGCAVFHPYRLKCRRCGKAIPDYQKRCSCGSDRFSWNKGPHFHIVGFGFIRGTKEIYESYGCVVRNLGVRRSVFWTLQYLLSHAGVFQDSNPRIKDRKSFHVVTWFGRLSYNKLSVKSFESPKDVCPYCELRLEPFEFVGGLDRPPPEPSSECVGDTCFLDEPYRWRPVMGGVSRC